MCAEAHLIESHLDADPARRRALTVETTEDGQVLPAREIRVKRRRFDETGYALRKWSASRFEIATEQANRAGIAPHEAKQDAQQGGLASAIGTEQSVHAAGMRDEIDRVQRVVMSVSLRDACGFEQWPIRHRGAS